MKIAPNQKQELDYLRQTLDQLDKIVDRKQRETVRGLRDRLDGWAAKIAVIGQVKAGKSTFLNAFLNQHDFLPNDVNPWTSVVTNIRVNMPGDPASGARFEFFDESDWDEIINGGTKIRQLAEQLLPGFDSELLREQSEQMRARAEKRLGKYYRTLLGGSHDYDFLSADLLKRYVCAGPGSDEGLERESLGRYAALTKVANVYMQMPQFQVPTIITDTPGVNDPFLVRDEFTCRSLDKSDSFVVVLSAHQPLTDVDIALIRILAKQDDKDVMIFINRIDELDDYATQLPRVIEDVEHRLRAAIPEIDFSIVSGSAYMADLVMRNDDEAAQERDEIDTEELAAYIQGKYGHVPEDQFDRLMLASGLDEVKATLSGVIDNGVGSRHLAQLMSDIRAEIAAMLFVSRRERDGLQTQMECLRTDVAEAAVKDLGAQISQYRDIQKQLEDQIELADTQIEKIVARYWTSLEKSLISTIDGFVQDQKPVFEDQLFRSKVSGKAPKALEIDTSPLQANMDAQITEFFRKSRAGTDVALSNCISACRQAIKDHFEDPTENIGLDNLPYDDFSSTLTLAKSTLKVELIADRGWAFWKNPSVNCEKSINALRAIAAAELRPSVEKILAAFNEAQVERAGAGMSRIQIMQRMIDDLIAEQTHVLKQDQIELESLARDPDRCASLGHRLQSKMEVLERRLLNLSALESRLIRAEQPYPAKAA